MSCFKEKGVNNMYLASCGRHIFSTKIGLLFLFILLVVQVSYLEASGWGNTQEAIEYEETLWNRVYFDMNGLHMTAFIPNYCGTVLQGNYVSMRGRIIEDNNQECCVPFSGRIVSENIQEGYASLPGIMADNVRYVIGTSFYPEYNPPESNFEFLNIVQEAYPDNLILPINNCESLGVLYGVDILPLDEEDTCFWRFLSTNDRLIKMRTNDTNENRRRNFFECIQIHCEPKPPQWIFFNKPRRRNIDNFLEQFNEKPQRR